MDSYKQKCSFPNTANVVSYNWFTDKTASLTIGKLLKKQLQL